MPVRTIRLGRRSLTGHVPGILPGTSVGFESRLERDFYTLLRFDLRIAEIEEQPVTIPYIDDRGRKATYTPDALATYRDDGELPFGCTRVLFEIKFWADFRADRKRLRPRFRAAQAWAREREMRFEVATERSIRTPLVRNAGFLLRFRRKVPDPSLLARLADVVADNPGTTCRAAVARLSPPESERLAYEAALWHLIVTGAVEADLLKPLLHTSTVWPTPPERAGVGAARWPW